MQVSRETQILNTVCIGLVLASGVIRLAAKQSALFSYNNIIFALFAAAGSIHVFQLQKRLLQPDVRRTLTGAALLMIFWMAVRTIKYDLLPSSHFTVRYAWYLYYLPMLFIPLLMFLSVLAIGIPHNKSINRRWYLLFIPSAVILGGILTNDLHQAAFRFNDGLALWNERSMTRGFVYYAAIIWISFLFIAMLAVVFIRCAVPEKRTRIWVPLLPLFIGACYIVFAVLSIDNLFTEMLNAPEIGCAVFAAFTECLICVRLFPNNDNYGAFWNASSIGAGIMDKEGVIRFSSEKSVPVTLKQVHTALDKNVILKNGALCLKSHAVRGGFGYWIRDISEIERLNDELRELGDITARENSVLEAETKMRAERLHIEEQNRLYDHMARGVKKQLDILDALLDSPPDDEKEFEKTMKYACVLNAYIKRQSNMILLSHREGIIDSEELRHAAAETLEYIRLCGTKALCSFDGQAELPALTVLLAYEILEAVLEASVPGAGSMLIYFKISEKSLTMQAEVNAPREIFSDAALNKKAAALGGTLKTETDENTEYVTLIIPPGGESA